MQVGFVFQQQAAAMVPGGAGGPIRGTKASDMSQSMSSYSSTRPGERGEYGGSYGSYGNRYTRSYSRPGAGSQRDSQGGGSRYRPY